ncbi:MAG: pre-peptidase C-terminal domain-containing protein [Leptolyngbyaceae cyanobacterium bins.349]|nr:pre-peptidase C-terminal domain-containing protein [Leptolyngbyaceae cyanobacterium bins.349]
MSFNSTISESLVMSNELLHSPLDIAATSAIGSFSSLTDPLQHNLSLSGSSAALPVNQSLNNTISTATNLGTIAGRVVQTGSVSSLDPIDFVRFQLGSTSDLSLTLTGLTADADLRLIQDVNNNGIAEFTETIAFSLTSGTNPESINLSNLHAGNYFVRVNQFSGSTNYTLTLTADAAGKTLVSARNLGIVAGLQSFNDFVGDNDTQDFYRFRLETSSNLSLSLSGLSDDADLQIIQDRNFNGTIDSGEIIHSATYGSNTSESINLANLATGNYFARVYRYGSANTNYTLNIGTPSSFFSNFNIYDASGDTSHNTVFQGGAIRLSYSLASGVSAYGVGLQAIGSDGTITNLGSWSHSSMSNVIVNLANFTEMAAGTYTLRAIAYGTGGVPVSSGTTSLGVLGWRQTNGSFTADTFSYGSVLGTGAVFLGRGGTDTLNLGIDRTQVSSINGLDLSTFDPWTNSTRSQATFRGSSFDFIHLMDGREIYIQGIENLLFSDGSRFELQIRTNDTHYGQQWNLRVSDVDSAWRFTHGSSNVLLASLDTGSLTVYGADLPISRLITNSTTDDNADSGHGHMAVSVMASSANNMTGVTGINWNSNVYVQDVYGSTSINLQQAIQQVINYARDRNMRVVFQGGIQGESWLNNGGTQAQLGNVSDVLFEVK